MATSLSVTNPLQRAFNLFILGLPSNDLDSLLNCLRDDEGRVAFETEFMRQATEVITAMAAKEQVPGSPSSSNGSTRTIRGKKTGDRKLRPLNSFIAYRSFYSTMFPDMTQKIKSGIIKDLWQADPYKGKWAILAKAYSTLRDDHGRNVSLDTFLELTVPFIGLIQARDYMEAMGCRVVITEEQNYIIETISPPRADVSGFATNYSVADVVEFCYERGYVDADNAQRIDQSEAVSQVSFATQPNTNVRTDQGVIILDNVNRAMPYNHGQNVTGQTPISTSDLLKVRYPTLTQNDLVKNIDAKVNELGQYNGGDPELYAPFHPAVQGFPTYDPLATEPFDGYDISEMPM